MGRSAKPKGIVIHGRQVEMVPLADLTPYAKNARTHPEDQLRDLERIIRDSGFTTPLIIDDAGEIIAGHGRAVVADRIGMAEVPCVRVAGLTAEQVKALRLSDNAIALRSGWDMGLLETELNALLEIGGDLDLAGFSDFQLGEIGIEGFTPEARIEEAEETPEPTADPLISAGEIWLLGDHRVLCGDSTKAEDVARLLDGAKPHLMVTDPPYGIGYEYRTHDDKNAAQNAALVADVFAHAPKGKVWTPGAMNLRRDLDRFGEAKQIFWHKGFAAAGNGLGGASTVEPILVVSPPIKNLPDDYLHFPTDRSKVDGVPLRKLHSCPKPVALFAHLLRAFSARGHGIFEPFCGSGTTLIACEMEGRRCYGLEIDPAYGQVIVERWENFTGKTATREDGVTLADLAKPKAKRRTKRKTAKA